MRTLVVSSYPPRHCGIGAYARAQVERWRSSGEGVLVVSPEDGDGDVRVPFRGGRPFRAALRLGRRADRILVHYQPALYLGPRSALAKVTAAASLWWLAVRRPQTEILVHEADRPRWWRPDEQLIRSAFRSARRLLFHTDRELAAFEQAYGFRPRAVVVPHVEGVSVIARSREEARRILGLTASEPLILAPGFIHPHKGLDRAVRVFTGPGRLVVLGTVKDPTDANLRYEEELRLLAERTEGVELREAYLEDDEFDAWIAAADGVVLPYRRSWSSGVLARAQLLGTPAIVTDVGGLAEQAGPGDVVIRDDQELAEAMAKVASGAGA
ncbi:MAG TPA: glycosyltransferase family 4 protein [Actinomycetota bacterium]|nr:glycosyltransferase family 4 protein [Actinomycetota bacterium]